MLKNIYYDDIFLIYVVIGIFVKTQTFYTCEYIHGFNVTSYWFQFQSGSMLWFLNALKMLTFRVEYIYPFYKNILPMNEQPWYYFYKIFYIWDIFKKKNMSKILYHNNMRFFSSNIFIFISKIYQSTYCLNISKNYTSI